MASSAIGATGALASLPAGSLVDFAGSSAPGGWLMCDGSAVSRTVYAQLFASVGTAYGVGDGSTTFNLPDFRGRFARYNDDMGTGAAGRDTGRVLGTAQAEATKKNGLALGGTTTFASSTHHHSVPVAVGFGANSFSFETPPNGYNGTISGSGTSGANPMGVAATRAATVNSRITTYSDNASGTVSLGNGDAETRPINLSCNRIIKY